MNLQTEIRSKKARINDLERFFNSTTVQIRRQHANKCQSIDFKTLKSAPINQKFELCPGVVTQKIGHTSREIFFSVEMQPGALIPAHCHDCKEIIRIKSGQAEEITTAQVLNPGQSIALEAYEVHTIQAGSAGAKLLVILKKEKC